ncbi:MAG: amidase [Gemmatimonadetes bacterium]|nr:amidase [Gemmatimonadota bacterium]
MSELAAALRGEALALSDYLDRLESTIAAKEPEIHALLPEPDRFARLRAEAAALLSRYPDAAGRPPLFGIVLGVKDIFRVEGFETRAGSRLPPEALAGAEAPCVTALRRAGVLILGKTATTEFAFRAPASTRNPRRLAHTPGGSSSGSAAAVAAGFCPLALGSQTIGSTIRPASFCGVVGMKPSYERVSRQGVIPLAPSLDHVGLLTTDAAGAATAASVMMHDWDASRAPRGRGGTGRPVLGVPRGPYLERASAEGLDYFEKVCRRLVAAGYDVRDVRALENFEAIERQHLRAMACEAARVHAVWFARYRELYHPLTVELLERGRGVAESELGDALDGRLRVRRELGDLMQASGIDAWIAPAATGPAPRGLENTGDAVMSLPWTYGGLPVLALPTGSGPNGLPMGIQIVGDWHADEAIVAWGTRLEEVLS